MLTQYNSYLLGMFVLTLLGAVLPLLKNWSQRTLHLFIAFGAGIFLGALFLHILPEINGQGTPSSNNAILLLGFLALLFFERVLFNQHERHCGNHCSHGHKVIGYTTLMGLSIHALAEGISLGFAFALPHVALPLFIAIVSHKAVAAFSLATVLRLAGFKPLKSFALLVFFALTSPLAAIASLKLSHAMSAQMLCTAQALAGGTFLYVATCDYFRRHFTKTKGVLAHSFHWQSGC